MCRPVQLRCWQTNRQTHQSDYSTQLAFRCQHIGNIYLLSIEFWPEAVLCGTGGWCPLSSKSGPQRPSGGPHKPTWAFICGDGWGGRPCFRSGHLKPGFHYPSSRPELTGRVAFFDTRQLGPSSRVSKMHPSWRTVNSARQLGPWTRVVETGLYCLLLCKSSSRYCSWLVCSTIFSSI